jgi:hypothetical protein
LLEVIEREFLWRPLNSCFASIYNKWFFAHLLLSLWITGLERVWEYLSLDPWIKSLCNLFKSSEARENLILAYRFLRSKAYERLDVFNSFCIGTRKDMDYLLCSSSPIYPLYRPSLNLLNLPSLSLYPNILHLLFIHDRTNIIVTEAAL